MKMSIEDPSTTKYMVKAHIKAEGVIEKSDVVGAIFGQTEGLLGDELDLRDLQKSTRVGRIEVEIESKNGKSEGTILLPTATDKVETAILAAALESIDRVGPCKARINIEKIEDVRVARRKQVINRAKELINKMMEEGKIEGETISENVRQSVQVEEIINFGPEHLPAGPNVDKSDATILVEGRRDVLNLLKYGIKNAIAIGGTNVPKTIINLSKEKTTTAFLDGDRGGELILRELLQVAEIDFVARAPETREVEEIPQKLIIKALKNKLPAEQFAEMYNIKIKKIDTGKNEEKKIGEPKKSTEIKETSILTPEQQNYKAVLNDIAGSLKAVILDENGKEIKKIPIRELTDRLKQGKNVSAVIFDGIITQRLLDIAVDKGINTIVGVKIGNVTKLPTSIKTLTKDDLQ